MFCFKKSYYYSFCVKCPNVKIPSPTKKRLEALSGMIDKTKNVIASQ